MVLKDNLSAALFDEENGLIDALAFIIKQVNGVYIDSGVRDQIVKLLNVLFDDTVRHSDLLSKFLTELSFK